MKNFRNTIIWIRNIFAILTIVSGTYVIGKAARLWMLFISSRNMFTQTEWDSITRITELDITLIVGFVIVLFVFVIINKKCKKWF